MYMFLTVFRVAWVMFCLNGKYVVAWGSMFCCYLQGTNSYLGYEKNLGKLVSYSMFTFKEFRVMLEGNLNLFVGRTIITKRHSGLSLRFQVAG